MQRAACISIGKWPLTALAAPARQTGKLRQDQADPHSSLGDHNRSFDPIRRSNVIDSPSANGFKASQCRAVSDALRSLPKSRSPRSIQQSAYERIPLKLKIPTSRSIGLYELKLQSYGRSDATGHDFSATCLSSSALGHTSKSCKTNKNSRFGSRPMRMLMQAIPPMELRTTHSARLCSTMNTQFYP